MTTGKIKVALLYGGPSSEHEISLRSAAAVLHHLNPDQYDVYAIGIDKSMRCYQNPITPLRACGDTLPVQTPSATPLLSLLVNGRFVLDVDVVFPVVHGPLLEDGALQGLLELAQVPYVGSHVLGSALCMDKELSRRITTQAGIHSTNYLSLTLTTSSEQKKALCQQALQHFGLPLFVKPSCMGSSVGIQKVLSPTELEKAVNNAFRFDETVLIEQAVNGREIEVAVLENETDYPSPHASIPGELIATHPDGFYSYNAKYIDSDSTKIHIPADLSSTQITRLQEMATQIFTLLKCHGMARVDFFIDTQTDTIYFNEVNTIPGFTSISMYPQLWMASGLSYETLLDRLINLARSQFKLKQQRVRDYQ